MSTTRFTRFECDRCGHVVDVPTDHASNAVEESQYVRLNNWYLCPKCWVQFQVWFTEKPHRQTVGSA